MKSAIALVSLLVVSFSACMGQAFSDPDQRAANAAVKYLRADAALRQSYPLAPDATANLEAALNQPLNVEDEKLVVAAGYALAEFDHGAAIKQCDWAMSVEEGPFANTAHRGVIRELAFVSAMRARLRFRDGDMPGAMSDLLAALAAARHLSVDGSLASILMSYKLENELAGVLALNLHRFAPAQLNELARGLDALPAGFSMGEAFESEKVRRDDFFLLAMVQGATTREELIARLIKNAPALKSNQTLAGKIVDGCGGSPAGFVNCVKEKHAFYQPWPSRFALPPEQFEAAYNVEFEKVSLQNPLVREFTPNLPRFRWAEAYSRTRRALLRAAVAVRLGGPAALKQYLDPYDQSPFSYVPLDGGFRLESRLRDGGAPLTLSIAGSSETKNQDSGGGPGQPVSR